ncbi:MAG: cbb3-type cytochrome oxidase subunit 3 [Betaproteobacteria bacterium]|nr:cbb3-type cytochrome oxidase subunit 3 [Betaproteobacteria bacterium]
MDINDLRSFFTVVMFLLFIGIVAWAWSGKRKQSFDEAARLALDEDAPLAPAAGRGAGHGDK